MRSLRLIVGSLGVLLLAACGARESSEPVASTTPTEPPTVAVYNWYDYIGADVLKEFEARTGIHVVYDVFDSNQTLEAKLLAGRSGYDVVFPSAATLQRLLPAGLFQPIDRTKLTHYGNIDPRFLERLAAYDPGNAHALPYTWGITGLAYSAKRVQELAPTAPTDSWSLLLDPAIARQLSRCGIGLYDSPTTIFPSTLAWLGEAPTSADPALLPRASRALQAVRPFIRKVTEGSLVADLAAGELCVIIASDGDARMARMRSEAVGRKDDIRFANPREGATIWFDVAAVLKDAPHPQNALRFLDFLLDAQIAAQNSTAIGFANGNAASQPLMDVSLRNETLYPDAQAAQRLFPELPKDEDYLRVRTREWTRFRTGK